MPAHWVVRRGVALLALSSLFLAGCAACLAPPSKGDGGSVDGGDGGAGGCPVSFSFRPSVTASSVALLGEWDQLERGRARVMDHDGSGGYSTNLLLEPGTYGYLFLVNGGEQLDPANPALRSVNGKSYSRLTVPPLSVEPGSAQTSRPAAGEGSFTARIRICLGGGRPEPPRLEGSLRTPADRVTAGWQPRALQPGELALSPDGSRATLTLSSLADGKYTATLRAVAGARESEALFLPFWVEPQPFSFRDSALYMLVTDRFRNGDPSNDPAPTPNVPTSVDFQGGDLKGVELAIAEGYFDRLGVRTLWLTPWQTQPARSYLGREGRQATGYHGYWPIRARQVDPRWGGAEALHRMVEEAHRHGIRIIMDAVLNHVHEEHEYFLAQKDWFRTGCVCSDSGCGWDAKRLECVFAPYLPDVNWNLAEVSDQFIADLLWWMEEFDLDGLRIDAVKHVEDSAITRLAGRVRERFEQAGTDYYLFGETFTGDYGLINRYISPTALDAQLDFPLFMKVPETVFARDELGFLHVKYWSEQSQLRFQGAPMVTFVGNHDVARFITKADPANRDRQGSQWENLPGPPVGQEPYDRLWLAMLNLLTSPGVPLLYYGDEYGEFGGSDPDNRHLANREPNLWPEQRSQLERMRKLLLARGRLRGLARGPMTTLWANSEDNGKGNLWAYTRTDPDPKQSALVVLNRAPEIWQRVVVRFPPELGWSSGKVYDLLTEREWPIASGEVTIDVPARGGVVLGLR